MSQVSSCAWVGYPETSSATVTAAAPIRLPWRRASSTGAPRRYADVEIYDALLGDLDGARAARVESRTLGRLSPELVRTLEAYLESGSSVAATARALYLHRNTVHYRLRKVEARTGLDLDRMEHRMLFELGLLARRLG